MLFLIIFIVEVGILFALSQLLTKSLSLWFYHLFRHQHIVIQLLSVLFLPGVVVHELSHLLTASILFVPTGEIEFLPEIRGNEVKMGSVSIAQTDPIRRFFIGVAPLVVGLSVLFLLFWYFIPHLTLISWQTLLLLYAVFEVSNTMFSSKKDMEGAIGLLAVIILLVILFYFLRVNVFYYMELWAQIPLVSSIFLSLNMYLGVAIVLDGIVLGVTKGLLKLHKNH